MRHLSGLLLVAGVAFADVAPRAVCRSDADCVMASFQGCCGACCPTPPRAWLRSELARVQERCAEVDCAERSCRVPCLLEPEVRQVAVCVAGTCEARAVADANPDFCSSDADCESSTFAGCCGSCCPVPPVAVTHRRAQLQRQACAAATCEPPDCRNIACAQVMPSPIRPVCRSNRCVAERPNLVIIPPPPPECRSDAECGVDLNPPPGSACWSTPCGCCPSPRAVPVEQVRPPPVRRQSSGQSPFGLSQGNSGASCPACPSMTRVNAGCRSGRCVLR